MPRAIFIVVTGFWVTMNVLLWQTAFGSRKNGGTVPVETVWGKILTAADDSSLTVYHHGQLVGACHLRTGVGEEWSNIGDDNEPSGPPVKTRGYVLQWDGTVVIPEWTNRLRFDGNLKLDKDRDWQELNAKVAMRPATWEFHSVASERNIHLQVGSGSDAINTVIEFSDLQNPAVLTYKLLGPAAGDAVASAGLGMVPQNAQAMALGIKWDAREDSIRIGRSSVQVYRLHTRMIGYDLSVIVSRAGEILRVDFPDGFLLINDRMATTEERPTRKLQNISTNSPDLRSR